MRSLPLLILLAYSLPHAHTQTVDMNPKCHSPKAGASPNSVSFVFVLDHTLGKEKGEKLKFLYKAISCEIPDASVYRVAVLHLFPEKIEMSQWMSAPSMGAELVKHESVDDDPHGRCVRLDVAMVQDFVFPIGADGKTAPVHFVFPFDETDLLEDCDVPITFQAYVNEKFSGNKDLHFDGILFGKRPEGNKFLGERFHVRSWQNINQHEEKVSVSVKARALYSFGPVYSAYKTWIAPILNTKIDNDVMSMEVKEDEKVDQSTVGKRGAEPVVDTTQPPLTTTDLPTTTVAVETTASGQTAQADTTTRQAENTAPIKGVGTQSTTTDATIEQTTTTSGGIPVGMDDIVTSEGKESTTLATSKTTDPTGMATEEKNEITSTTPDAAYSSTNSAFAVGAVVVDKEDNDYFNITQEWDNFVYKVKKTVVPEKETVNSFVVWWRENEYWIEWLSFIAILIILAIAGILILIGAYKKSRHIKLVDSERTARGASPDAVVAYEFDEETERTQRSEILPLTSNEHAPLLPAMLATASARKMPSPAAPVARPGAVEPYSPLHFDSEQPEQYNSMPCTPIHTTTFDPNGYKYAYMAAPPKSPASARDVSSLKLDGYM